MAFQFRRDELARAVETRGNRSPDDIVFRGKGWESVLVSRRGRDLWRVFQVKVANQALVNRLGGHKPDDTFSVWLTQGFPWPGGYRMYPTIDMLIRHGILATQGPSVGALLNLDMPRMQNMVLCGSPHFYYSSSEMRLMKCATCKERATHFLVQTHGGNLWFKVAYCARCGNGHMVWGPAGTNPQLRWAVIGKLARAVETRDWILVHQRETPNFYVLWVKPEGHPLLKESGFVGQLTYHNGYLYFVNSISRNPTPGDLLQGGPQELPADLLPSLQRTVTEHAEELLSQPDLTPWPSYSGGLSFYWEYSSGDEFRVRSYWGMHLRLVPAGKYVNNKRVAEHSVVDMMVGWY